MAGLNLAEKILSEHLDREVHAGDLIITPVDWAFCQDANARLTLGKIGEMGFDKVLHPERVLMFMDHFAPAPRPEVAADHQFMRDFARKTGASYAEVGRGICHQVICEQYARPGDLIIGADSHTCTMGALAAFATGMGSTDVAVAMALGKQWLRVPKTLRVNVTGTLSPGVYSKDLVLDLIGRIGSGGANYLSIEWGGPTIEALSMEARITLPNMAVEAGAKTGLIASDETTRGYMERHGRGDQWRALAPDPDAVYQRSMDMDAAALAPVVALPGNIDRVVPVGAPETRGVKVDQVFVGSCTNARIEDLRIFRAYIKGRKRHPDTRLVVTPASSIVYQMAAEEGILADVVEFGGAVLSPGCQACFAGHGAVLADGEHCVSTINRNYPGRMGSPNAFIYLTSPATAAAAAITGTIADPREFLPQNGAL